MFWLPSKDYETILDELRSLGFSDIVIGTQNTEQVKAIKDRGLKVHAVIVAFRLYNNLKRPEYLAEDPLGRKHVWFNSGCPNNPTIRSKCLEIVEEWITKYEVDGIILDGIRFASPGSGLDVFATCFCKHCEAKAKENGFNFNKMKRALLELLKLTRTAPRLLYESMMGHYVNLFHLLISYDGLLDWIEFRSECIAEHIRDVRNLVKSVSSSIELGAYVFTPSLAPLVGQCYYKISEYLDLVKPMIYRIGRGVACFNYELYIIIKDLLRWNPELKEADVMSFIYNVFSLSGELPSKLDDLLEHGLPYEVLERETLMARALIPSSGTLHPIIMLRDKGVERATELMLKAKVDGIDFFMFKEELRDNIRKAVRVVNSFITH